MFWYFSIIGEFFGGICLCFVITLAVVAGIFYLIKAFYPRTAFNAVSLVVGAIMFLLLFVQASMMYGALSIKGKIEYYTETVQNEINRYYNSGKEILNDSNIQQITDKIIEDYPIASQFVEDVELDSYNIENIAEAYTAGIRENLNNYAWRRAGWILLFLVAGTVVIAKTAGNSNGKKNSRNKTKANYRGRMQTQTHRH